MYSNSNSIIDELRNEFRFGSMINRLIIINVGVFLVFNVLLDIFFRLLTQEGLYGQVLEWFYVTSSVPSLLLKPWTLLTYQFFHGGFLHILFNMLILYMFGRIFREFLGNKKILPVYIMGGLAGAVLYIVFYNIFPFFDAAVDNSTMLGASASVMAIMVAISTLRPNYEVFLFGLVRVKIIYIALFFVGMDVLTMLDSNSGGHIAHLGGAVFGYVFTRQLRAGSDWSVGFNNLVDGITNWLSSPSKPKKSKVKMAYKKDKNKQQNKSSSSNTNRKQSSTSQTFYRKETSAPKASTTEEMDADTFSKSQQDRVDKILDKIAKSGWGSLSKEEQEFLHNVSKK